MHPSKRLASGIAAILTLSLLATTSPLLAQDGDVALAMESYEEGKRLFSEDKYAQAAQAFREANRLNPNWRIFYNIGQCEALAKRHGLALEAFEAYLSQGGDGIPADRREVVTGELGRLQKIVGMLDVKAPDGAIIVVDGVERETIPLPGPLMVASGISHNLIVRLGEETILERSIKISGGKTFTVDATVKDDGDSDGPQEDGAQDSPGVTPPKSNTLKAVGWVALGVGAAMAIGGGVTGGMALSISSDLDGKCADGNCTENQWEDMDRMDTLATTSNVLLIAGGVVAATGVVLLIVDAKKEKVEPANTALLPTVGPGFAGMSLRGRF